MMMRMAAPTRVGQARGGWPEARGHKGKRFWSSRIFEKIGLIALRF